jgi:hypothetical protein
MSLMDQAIEFAAHKHRHQQRKGTDIPYISHPYGVGMILLKAKCKEEVIIAGILHDTLEDTDTTEEEILNQFGQNVLDLVKGCSEPDKGASWEERKKHTHEFLKQAPLSIRQVACADKLHNLRSIKRNLEELGEKAWERFNRGRDSQEWYYTEIVESLGYTSRFPLLDLLQDEVEAVFGGSLENEVWKNLRRDEEFFNLAFETVYDLNFEKEKWETKMNQHSGGGLDLLDQVHSLSYPIQPAYEEEFYQMADYLQGRGISFQSNSEGPIMLIGFCTVLKKLLNLYPHEIYHHFKRYAKRGIV